MPLRPHTQILAQGIYSNKNIITMALMALAGTVAIAFGGVRILAPTLRWFVAGDQPDALQRRAAFQLTGRQSAIFAATWLIGGAGFILLNLDSHLAVLVPVMSAVVLGGVAASVSTGLLLAQRFLRPILAAASRGVDVGFATPGVFSRLLLAWFLCSVLPIGVISILVCMRSYGWIIHKTGSVAIPVLTVAFVTVALGLPAMIMTARSISDPVGEVVEAMAQVERGRTEAFVAIYERSQLGRLQRGFNRMVAGLVERERVRDLFGRHVGAHVARNAIAKGVSLSGDVMEVAVLFIDIVGSTRLAASRPPQEVATLLNDFFRIVVDAVDEHYGLVNKFAGDAALAIFGAPLPTYEPASAALATARVLRAQLRDLPAIDFGIGVSAGQVFAGNVGAENRYEYTVIGDAVNEAARLADLAKTSDGRLLCSAAAVDSADSTERARWTQCFSTVLRGRSEATRVLAPTDAD
ncbi:adenylate/guanylate cyclase domain-containing protein [Mycobacterium sp. ML4]